MEKEIQQALLINSFFEKKSTFIFWIKYLVANGNNHIVLITLNYLSNLI